MQDESSRSDPPSILLSAYQCGPGMGSVSQIGWEWYSRLSDRGPVTLVTHARNRLALEAAGAPLPGTEVIYIDTEWFAGPLYRFARWLFPRSEHPVFLISSFDFFVYDAAARRMLARRRRDGQTWDVIHQPTPVSPLAATTLHRLGLPLVVGPWNGGLRSPEGFPEIMRAESGWLYSVRHLGRWLDRLLGCTRQAQVILAATRATREALPASAQARTRFMLENGVDLATFPDSPWPPAPGPGRPLQILFVGRLLPFKGVSMLVEALEQFTREHPAQLHVVGDGTERLLLQTQVERLGLASQVHFHGALSHADIAALMRGSHVFCLPSVRESGGAVLLEAMSSGRPVIALDYGGPAEVVNETVGRLIPAHDRPQVVAGLVECLRNVVEQPVLWAKRGQAGRQRVAREFAWDAKINQALAIYQDIRRTA